MTDPRRKGGDPAESLAGLLELARTKLTGPAAPGDAGQDPSYLAVRRRLEGGGAQAVRGRRIWLLVAAPALAALVLGAGLVYRGLRPAGLDYVVQGAAVIEGGYLRARADAEAQLSFSDGSQVQLEPSSGGRVAAVGPRGAQVLLEHGRARVRVVPRPSRDGQWVFDAGPCRLHVTGTRFDMRWSRDDQVLEVRLYSGSVTVKGPPAPEGVVMQAGQQLVMDVRRDLTRLSALLPAPGATPPGSDRDAEAPEEMPAPPEPAAPGPARSQRRPAPPAAGDWSAQVLAGDFAGVLREARRRGLAQVLARHGAADVMALAEAARLSRENALARRALRTLVGRFPGSPQGDKALFLLGRLAEDVDGDPQAALRLYQSYLQAAPDGPYRDEAQGRQMTATLRADGPRQARPLAEAYLRRYPDGAYAEPARAILGRSP